MPPGHVTRLLLEWSRGKQSALDELIPLVYDELRKLASRLLERERPGHTLQATALVHEAYQTLVDQRRVHWQERAQFFAVAARIMRRILVDHARRHRAAKRPNHADRVSLDDIAIVTADPDPALVHLDDALNRLTELDERLVRIVEMRFFGGLTIKETAEVLEISPATVKNDWRMARAWLYGELNERSP